MINHIQGGRKNLEVLEISSVILGYIFNDLGLYLDTFGLIPQSY